MNWGRGKAWGGRKQGAKAREHSKWKKWHVQKVLRLERAKRIRETERSLASVALLPEKVVRKASNEAGAARLLGVLRAQSTLNLILVNSCAIS